MTEDEAKTRWCPFADSRTITIDAKNNRRAVFWGNSPEDAFIGCIASECMAWRWQTGKLSEGTGIKTQGYCGLAGKP